VACLAILPIGGIPTSLCPIDDSDDKWWACGGDEDIGSVKIPVCQCNSFVVRQVWLPRIFYLLRTGTSSPKKRRNPIMGTFRQ
jgi:hypothetical protein